MNHSLFYCTIRTFTADALSTFGSLYFCALSRPLNAGLRPQRFPSSPRVDPACSCTHSSDRSRRGADPHPAPPGGSFLQPAGQRASRSAVHGQRQQLLRRTQGQHTMPAVRRIFVLLQKKGWTGWSRLSLNRPILVSDVVINSLLPASCSILHPECPHHYTGGEIILFIKM